MIAIQRTPSQDEYNDLTIGTKYGKHKLGFVCSKNTAKEEAPNQLTKRLLNFNLLKYSISEKAAMMTSGLSY